MSNIQENDFIIINGQPSKKVTAIRNKSALKGRVLITASKPVFNDFEQK